jgi:hypothetical protein
VEISLLSTLAHLLSLSIILSACMKFLPSIKKSTESTQNLRSDELTPAELEANQGHVSTMPSLQQILNRKSLPPVCLYNLYIVMRDRLRNEEILDFYLDLKHHEVLWRKYIRSLVKAGVLDESDLKDGANSISVAVRVQIFDKTVSAQAISAESNLKTPALKTPDIVKQHEEQMIHSHQVREAAERIAHRYVVQSAYKEIAELPVSIRNEIIGYMQDQGRYDPLIFVNAQTWTVNAIQHFSYPKFIEIKSTRNITQWQQLLRICFGLSILFIAFTLELTMLFLGWQVWGARVWVSNRCLSVYRQGRPMEREVKRTQFIVLTYLIPGLASILGSYLEPPLRLDCTGSTPYHYF